MSRKFTILLIYHRHERLTVGMFLQMDIWYNSVSEVAK
jgi:hypothetical protein